MIAAVAAQGIGSMELLAGVIVAMIVGYVAIKLVSKIVASKVSLLRLLHVDAWPGSDRISLGWPLATWACRPRTLSETRKFSVFLVDP